MTNNPTHTADGMPIACDATEASIAGTAPGSSDAPDGADRADPS